MELPSMAKEQITTRLGRLTMSNEKSPQEIKPTIIYSLASDIQMKPIDWLWKGRIAKGKVSMIAGNPGLGKSQLTANMAAIVSSLGVWPDESKCPKGSVIFLSAEDDASDTIVPRLKAAGAELKSVAIIEAVSNGYNSDGEIIPKHFNLASDIPYLDSMLNDLKDVALIIIDPITAYLGDTDSHRTSDVRALLAPLSRLAEKYNVAIVCVSHLNKGGNKEALMRITGSLGFVAAARAAFVVVKDQDNPAKRLFLPVKNNLGNDQTGLAFSIEPFHINGEIETSRINWSTEIITITADEALSPKDEPEEKSALDEAEEFLCDLLINGPVSSTQVQESAKNAGHAWATIRRAKSKLGITPQKNGKKEWFWELPKNLFNFNEDAQGAKDARTKTLGTLRNMPIAEQQDNDREVF